MWKSEAKGDFQVWGFGHHVGGHTHPEIDNMGRVVGFRMGGMRKEEMTSFVLVF